MAHDQEVLGSNPRTVYLDGCKQFASYYIKEKLKINVAKRGTPKKYFKKYVNGNDLHVCADMSKSCWPELPPGYHRPR
jgi:hypothetical protein